MKVLNLLAAIGMITVIHYACKIAMAINDAKEAARKREESNEKKRL